VTDKPRKSADHTVREPGRYANFFQIGHSAYEFLMEFGQQDGNIHTRIYLSPQHARILSDLLQEALREHNLLVKDPGSSSARNIQ